MKLSVRLFLDGLKIGLLVLSLSSVVGCAGVLQSVVARPIGPLPTSTISVARSSPSTSPPTDLPQPTLPALPPQIEATSITEPSPTPAYAIGQHSYSTTLQVTADDGSTYTANVNYLLYLPQGYNQSLQYRWPLILFLHGAGERGTDPQDITRYSIPAFLTATPDFPFVVLSPQSPPDNWWSNQVDVLDVLLNQIQVTYAVDPRRVYLTGQSMGGFGTWAMALKYPTRFAAIVPVASGWDFTNEMVPANICDLKHVPIWVFHGALDENVLPDQVTAMVEALQACSGNVRFTLYSDADHLESSNRAYADPALYEWLLNQTLR